jgi:hypothetical protein
MPDRDYVPSFRATQSSLWTPGTHIRIQEDKVRGPELITDIMDYPSDWDFRDERFKQHLADAKRMIAELHEKEGRQFDGGPFVMKKSDGSAVLIKRGFYVRGPLAVPQADLETHHVEYVAVQQPDGSVVYKQSIGEYARWYFTAKYITTKWRSEATTSEYAWRDHPYNQEK